MYTGIIQKSVEIINLDDKPGLRTITLKFDDELLENLMPGASVSVDGVCLTVANIDGLEVSFDAMSETLAKTTLGELSSGNFVNVERSAKYGAEIGGHQISGHVDGKVEITKIEKPENNCVITFRVPKEHMKFIFEKGYIALNGASLTITDVDHNAGTFKVFFIPETLRITTFSERKVNDKINFEIDKQTQVIVNTVERYMAAAV